MKLMKLFAVLALVSISNTAFGYDFTFNNHTNQAVNGTIRFAGAGHPYPLQIPANTIGVFHGYRNEDFPVQSIELNGVDMGYHATPALRDISFNITEDRAGNLNLKEVQ